MDKVIDIEERIPTLRERRRKRTNRKFLALLFIFLTILAGLIYSQTQFSKIQSISVTGENLYSDEDYIAASKLAIGDSMWSFDADEVGAAITGLEWVESAEVEKNWLTAVEITVSEYPSVGYLETATGYQKLLANGYAVELPVETVAGPVYTNFEDQETRREVAAQVQQLDSEVSNLVSQVILTEGREGTANITLYMTDGNEVRARLNSLAEKLDYYPSLIAQLEDGVKGVFDMEVGITFRSYDDVYGPPKEVSEDEETEEP
ncbi:cell division protein FtsQ/DivIB [Planococcus sp. CAU13]|uniref:cell division protein FtsQ/DivIB n=1 Tax=Planococcus sp. CAU13 TaxID=1541197 RepID=UPI0005300903|nr:FtsQ-type POTRA domain-containing protein [Planococcus sp. CAU13]